MHELSQNRFRLTCKRICIITNTYVWAPYLKLPSIYVMLFEKSFYIYQSINIFIIEVILFLLRIDLWPYKNLEIVSFPLRQNKDVRCNAEPFLWSILHDETEWNGNCSKCKERESRRRIRTGAYGAWWTTLEIEYHTLVNMIHKYYYRLG